MADMPSNFKAAERELAGHTFSSMHREVSRFRIQTEQAKRDASLAFLFYITSIV